MPILDHPVFDTPDDDAVLYRYMSFTKFAALLERRAIYFSSASDFEDTFEGAFRPSTVASNMQELWFRRLKQFVFISSWQQSQHESLAMWKIYLDSVEGVAIRSSVGQLRAALNDSAQAVHIGQVQYIDYDQTEVPADNLFAPYLYKQMSFSYEQEVRAVLNLLPSESGVFPDASAESFVPVDLSALIDQVVISPFAPSWFSELVTNVVARYEIDRPVERSTLRHEW